MKLSISTFFFQCGSQGIDPVAIRMFKHRVFEEILPFYEIHDFPLHISTKIAPKIVSESRVFDDLKTQEIVKSLPWSRVIISQFLVFSSRQNSGFIAEILFEKSRKLEISGVYPPLSYPLRGPYGILSNAKTMFWPQLGTLKAFFDKK